MTNKEQIFKDFSLNTVNPYANVDKEKIAASISLLSIGTRFYKVDRTLTQEEANDFLPIMKDGIACVDKLLNVEHKQVSKDFIINHKNLRNDLISVLDEKKSSETVFNSIRLSLDEEYNLLIAFIQSKLSYFEKKAKKNANQVGYITIIAYLKRELGHQRSKQYYTHEVAISLLRTVNQKSASTQDEIVDNLLSAFLEMYKKENETEKSIIMKMCKAIKNIE